MVDIPTRLLWYLFCSRPSEDFVKEEPRNIQMQSSNKLVLPHGAFEHSEAKLCFSLGHLAAFWPEELH